MPEAKWSLELTIEEAGLKHKVEAKVSDMRSLPICVPHSHLTDFRTCANRRDPCGLVAAAASSFDAEPITVAESAE